VILGVDKGGNVLVTLKGSPKSGQPACRSLPEWGIPGATGARIGRFFEN